jgi:hypothetical protein
MVELPVVSLDKILNVVRHVAHLQVASAAQLLGNVTRNILRPAFGGVKGNYADRVFVFTRKQVEDDGFQIGKLDVGFAVDQAIPAEVRRPRDRRSDRRPWARSTASSLF